MHIETFIRFVSKNGYTGSWVGAIRPIVVGITADIEIITESSFELLKNRVSRRYMEIKLKDERSWTMLTAIQKETIANLLQEKVSEFNQKHLIPKK